MSFTSEPIQPSSEPQKRQTVLDEIAVLPAEALAELLVFIQYLQYRFNVVTSAKMTDNSVVRDTSSSSTNESPAVLLAAISELPEEQSGLEFMGNQQDESIYTY